MTGKVYSEFNEPIANVNVIESFLRHGTLLTTGNGTVTDIDGNYNLQLINTNNAVVFSHIAATTKTFNSALLVPKILIMNTLNVLDEIVINIPKKKNNSIVKNLLYITTILAILKKLKNNNKK